MADSPAKLSSLSLAIVMADLPLDQVRTLLAVVDEGTFEAAARTLHVTPSAVSQRIKALEQHTGRVLLVRSKPVRLTESGAVVIRFARQLAWLERDASAELGLSQTGTPVVLAVAVNADSLATWFLPALTGLADRGICFDLQREDQDHTAQLLSQGLVMAAVTSAPQPIQGCVVRALGQMRYRAMANPDFYSRHLGHGPLHHTLPRAPLVVFDRKDDLQDRFLRDLAQRTELPASDDDAELVAGGAPPRHYVPTSEGFVDAVAAGLGWGMIPPVQAARRPDGALLDLAPDHEIGVPLFWQQWKLDSPALTDVADAVAAAASIALSPH
jgi:LysR family transcriptional regulator (chromosome initiation inhibitor)